MNFVAKFLKIDNCWKKKHRLVIRVGCDQENVFFLIFSSLGCDIFFLQLRNEVNDEEIHEQEKVFQKSENFH